VYKVTFLPEAERSLKKLSGEPFARIVEKIDWLQKKSDLIVHHPLTSLPDDLKGLCRVRVGDYRIIYWIYSETKTIKVYAIEHRSRVYKSLRG
jgi:mRNA-degrading endonuclease RelE of RelBE toxin-antitoxin system